MINNKAIKNKVNLINRRLNRMRKAGPKSVRFLFKQMKLMSGKRIRGLLVLLTAEINTKPKQSAFNTAVAMELLHNATLIHDDIVDNSPKRRGGRTLNRKLGHEFSVLAGDYLFSGVTSIVFRENNRELLRLFTEAIRDVCEGEIEEVYNKNRAGLPEKHYLGIISKKTASLMQASVEAGAVLGGIKGAGLKSLKSFGRNMGMAFQIKDDILDITSSSKKLGKPAASDIKEGKVTLPLILALKKAGKNSRKKIQRVLNSRNDTEKVKQAAAIIRRFGGIALAEQKAAEYLVKAKAALKRVKAKNKAKKRMLEELAEYAINRNY